MTDALPGLEPRAPRGKTTGGPVYQGVNKQIDALFPDRTTTGAAAYLERAGIIASVRSLAASIDRVSGHGGGRQASGHQLAMMHERLLAALEALAPADSGPDPFATLLEELGNAAPPATRVGAGWVDPEA